MQIFPQLFSIKIALFSLAQILRHLVWLVKSGQSLLNRKVVFFDPSLKSFCPQCKKCQSRVWGNAVCHVSRFLFVVGGTSYICAANNKQKSYRSSYLPQPTYKTYKNEVKNKFYVVIFPLFYLVFQKNFVSLSSRFQVQI